MEISSFGFLDHKCFQFFDKQALFDYIKLLEELVKRTRIGNNGCAEKHPELVNSRNDEGNSNFTSKMSWHEQDAPNKFIESSKSCNGKDSNLIQEARLGNNPSKVKIYCKYFAQNRCSFGKRCRYFQSCAIQR